MEPEDKETTLDTIRDIRILQRKRGYRFSLDALLLTDFVISGQLQMKTGPGKPKRIVDLGAGSGIIGILLAKRYEHSRVSCIEMQEELHVLCRKNSELNEVSGRVETIHADMREIPGSCTAMEHRFGLAVANPPFRKPGSGKISPGEQRAIARHEVALSFPELLRTAFYLLKGKGRFCFIHHPSRFIEIIEHLKCHRFEPRRACFVHPDVKSDAQMVLVEAVKEGRPHFVLERPLFIAETGVER